MCSFFDFDHILKKREQNGKARDDQEVIEREREREKEICDKEKMKIL